MNLPSPKKHDPPKIPPSALWSKLQQMPRPHKIVDFPRKGEDGEPIGKLAMWVLTQDDQMSCAVAAETFAKEHLKDGKQDDLGYETVYANQTVIEVLFRACRDPEDLSRPAFPSPSLIRKTLTADECGRLFETYLSVQLELGPIIAHFSPEELDAWIERIAAGGLAASPFTLLSSELQKILAYTMAARLVNSQTDTSSVGSQQDDGTPSSSPLPDDEAASSEESQLPAEPEPFEG